MYSAGFQLHALTRSRGCKELELNVSHVIADYSGEDLIKLSICLGNFCIQYYSYFQVVVLQKTSFNV